MALGRTLAGRVLRGSPDATSGPRSSPAASGPRRSAAIQSFSRRRRQKKEDTDDTETSRPSAAPTQETGSAQSTGGALSDPNALDSLINRFSKGKTTGIFSNNLIVKALKKQRAKVGGT